MLNGQNAKEMLFIAKNWETERLPAETPSNYYPFWMEFEAMSEIEELHRGDKKAEECGIGVSLVFSVQNSKRRTCTGVLSTSPSTDKVFNKCLKLYE